MNALTPQQAAEYVRLLYEGAETVARADGTEVTTFAKQSSAAANRYAATVQPNA